MNKNNKIEETRKLKIFERARTQVENLIFDCNPETCSSDEIEVSLEALVEAVPKLKDFWDKNLKKEEDKL